MVAEGRAIARGLAQVGNGPELDRKALLAELARRERERLEASEPAERSLPAVPPRRLEGFEDEPYYGFEKAGGLAWMLRSPEGRVYGEHVLTVCAALTCLECIICWGEVQAPPLRMHAAECIGAVRLVRVCDAVRRAVRASDTAKRAAVGSAAGNARSLSPQGRIELYLDEDGTRRSIAAGNMMWPVWRQHTQAPGIPVHPLDLEILARAIIELGLTLGTVLPRTWTRAGALVRNERVERLSPLLAVIYPQLDELERSLREHGVRHRNARMPTKPLERRSDVDYRALVEKLRNKSGQRSVLQPWLFRFFQVRVTGPDERGAKFLALWTLILLGIAKSPNSVAGGGADLDAMVLARVSKWKNKT